MNKSHLEIERVFILNSLPKLQKNAIFKETYQGYLIAENNGAEVRIKLTINSRRKYKLTFKLGNGLCRHEEEKIISAKSFKDLWQEVDCGYFKAREIVLIKNSRRYRIKEIAFSNSKLYIMETEFQNIDEAESFRLPKFFKPAHEVTDDINYRSRNLAKKYAEQFPKPIIPQKRKK